MVGDHPEIDPSFEAEGAQEDQINFRKQVVSHHYDGAVRQDAFELLSRFGHAAQEIDEESLDDLHNAILRPPIPETLQQTGTYSGG